MRPTAPFFLSVASLYATLGHAIFADEAHQIDYHHALLGLPQAHSTFFHRPSPASKASLLYTLSERLVLGAVNPKDGRTVWRQQLADEAQNQTTPSLLYTGEGGDALVTAIGGTVSSWDAADGRLKWHRRGYGQLKSLEVTGRAQDVFVLSKAQGLDVIVQRLAAETGAVLWEHHDPSGDIPHAVLACQNRVFYIALHSALLKGLKIKIIELSATTGNPVDQPILVASDSEVLSEESILYVGANSGIPYVIWTDKSLKNLKLNIIGTKHIVQANAPNSNGNPIERITVHAPKSSTAKAHILIQYQEADSHRAEVYHFTSEAAKKAYDLPRLSGKGAFSASSQDSDVYFIRYTAVENTLVSSIDSTVLNHWKIQPETDGAVMDLEDITHAVSEVVYRGGSTYAVRSALAMPSGEWKLVRNGESIWVRAEGLTGVVAAAFVEIPKLESLAEELAVEGRSDILTAYVHRVKRHLRDMQYFPAWIKALRQRVIANLTREKTHSKDHGLHRDGFGFRKLIVVATENGRLAALDTGNQGAVVWNIQAVNLRPGLKWEPLAIEAKEGTVLIRGEGGEFLRVVSSTGSILQYQPGTILSSWKTLIPVRDVSGNSVLLPVHDDGSLGELPIADFGKETVIVTQDKNHAVRGWTLSNDSKPVMSWGFAPAVGEYVTGIFARPQHDPVASIGKVLGDRNVLYKYLNPNIVLISTVNAKRSIASFYILDAISGAVIYSTHHPGVDLSRPIVSTVSENWFAYSLFSESSAVTQGATQTGIEELRGYQLVVSELYESPYPNDRGPLDSSSKSSSLYASKEGTRDIVDTPHVVSQTFLMPGPTSSMSVTSTLQGITTRSLLCVIPDINSIISISRAFVDPRRPVGRDATAAEIEEGLFRYNPVLEFEPKWILNHQRELISVSDVITSPSLLESTSLVFGFGEIDLFGTRVTPIGAFDILGKGFSKLQLVLTVVALAIGTVLVAPFVRRKQIDGTWKA